MVTCSRCEAVNDSLATRCTRCGGLLRPLSPQEEIGHVEYLLAQLPAWVSWRWLSPQIAGRLNQVYTRRRADLLAVPVEAPEPAQPLIPFSVTQGDAPTAPAPSPLPASPAEPAADDRAEVLRRVADARPTAAPPPVEPPHLPAAPPAPPPPRPVVDRTPPPPVPQTPWFGEFLEAHWVKLLALLAALLIFAGLRQVLGWQWVSRIAHTMVPLLPIGLAVWFHHFGMKARQQKTFGAFAYGVVAIVLAAFSVFAMNRFWLGFWLNSAFPARQSVFLGILASTCLAGWTWLRAADPRFLHVLAGALGALLYAGLQVAAPSPVLMPVPTALYCGAFLAYAALCMAATRLVRAEPATPDTEAAMPPHEALMLWAHIGVTVALARVVLPLAAGNGGLHDAGLFISAVAILYAVAAQVVGSPGMAYTAGAAALARIALMLAGRPPIDWYGIGWAALFVAVASLGLAAANGRASDGAADTPDASSGDRQGLRSAYFQIGDAAAVLGGLAVFARMTTAAGELSPRLTGHDWPIGCAIGACCAALYALIAVRTRIPAVLYGAAAALAFPLTLAANRLIAAGPYIGTHTFAHDLLPFAAVALVLGIVIARIAGEQWGRPPLHAASVAIGLAGTIAIAFGAQQGATAGLWSSLLPAAALAAIGAAFTREAADPLLSRILAGGSAAALIAAGGFLASTYAPGRPWNAPLAASLAVVLTAWLWTGIAKALRRYREDDIWIGPLLTIACAGSVVGAGMAAAGANAGAAWIAVVFALAIGQVASVASTLEGRELFYLAGATVVLGYFRLWAAADGGFGPASLLTVLLPLYGGLVFGWMGWRRDDSALAAVSAGAMAMAGAAGAALGGQTYSFGAAAGWASAAGTAAGAVYLLMAGGRWNLNGFSHAAGLLLMAAYIRGITLLFAVHGPWIAMFLLPGLLCLVALAWLLRIEDDSLHCVPLLTVVMIVAAGGLIASAGDAIMVGETQFLPIIITFLTYGALAGLAALVFPAESRALARASAALLLVAWLFGGAIGRGLPAWQTTWVLLFVVSGLAAADYWIVASRRTSNEIMAWAGIAGCAGWFALTARLLGAPQLWWAEAMLPFLVGLPALARLLPGTDEALHFRPILTVAAVTAACGIALTGSAAMTAGPSSFLPAVITLLSYGVAALAASLVLPQESGWLAGASVCLLVGLWLFGGSIAAISPDWRTAWVLVCFGSAITAVVCRIIGARRSSQELAYCGAVAACGAWYALTARVMGAPAPWWSAAMLPFLAALYLFGSALVTTKNDIVDTPFRYTALAASLLAAGWTFFSGIMPFPRDSWIVTLTLGAYGLAFACGAAWRRDAMLAGIGTTLLTTAYGYQLAAMGLSSPHWAFWLSAAGILWLVLGRALESGEELGKLSAVAYGVSAVVAMASGLTALLVAGTPNEGMFSILALAVTGTTFCGLYLFEQGDAAAHAGFGAYFLAYALIVYNNFQATPGVIDLYMIPIGLYLVALGHAAGKRAQEDMATGLWWLGLLITMTPTFLAFYIHHTTGGTPLHALLLLAECVFFIVWGIANRVKAFVFGGTLFALAFVAVLGASAVADVWSGLFAVGLGVALLMFVYLVTVNHHAISVWMQRASHELRQWR